ncbi:hypothetical protein [uncultured Flavobacterium sp.]|uniref:hypothetical protein n=1 Tax=uncultured Flavobacterium sp. TaxID=165435 RepID=UPI00260035EE|nr:hypothetical protein [uncultured Flavobacterium sp.]
MSTEIKNTLFRFVTMRAPGLVENEKVQKTFVQHPFVDGSGFKIYNDNHSTNSKKENLKNYASEFALSDTEFKKIDDLKVCVNDYRDNKFFEFATWLTSNRKKFTLEELEKSLNDCGLNISSNLSELNFDRMIILWDNLIYQIVTSKSNYIREATLSVLVANLFLQQKNGLQNDLKSLRKLAQARIIMPRKIFLEEETSHSASMEINRKDKPEARIIPTEPSETIEISLINDHLSQFKKMRESVAVIEGRYKKDKQRDLKNYNLSYEIAVEEAYNKATKIEKIIVDPITKLETVVFEYENLHLPKFDFKPNSETKYLHEYSKDTDHFWIVESCITILGYDTFQEIQDYVNKKEARLIEMQFARTNFSQKYRNTGGVILPVLKKEMQRISNSFTFQSVALNSTRKKLLLEFTGMESGVKIDQANYDLTFSAGHAHAGTSKSSTWVGNKLQVSIFIDEYIPDEEDYFRIEGTLVTQAGKQIMFWGEGDTLVSINTFGRHNIPLDPIAKELVSDFNDFSDSHLSEGNTGKPTYKYTLSGSGIYEYDGKGSAESPGNGNTTPDETFIPAGFGIKRLGIADYRKVEQEVCCYVPGEVSHIENVMASEYKERSTRRLRRTEDTITTSKEKESEKLTDSTSTDRFEMNSEVASVLAEDSHIGGYASMNAEYPKIKLSAGADFANNTSSEESNSQAVTHAKEITERVLDRVVQKVKEERISKVIEEFEENNKHGFDNRENREHVSGVYRWVDKIYKNKIINYGKRLMYEFMIPEPAAFHKQAVNEISFNDQETIERPLDPRNEGSLKLTMGSLEGTYKYWAEKYNATIEALPSKNISVGTEFNFDGKGGRDPQSWSEKKNIALPDGYKTIDAIVTVSGPAISSTNVGRSLAISVGNLRYHTNLGNDNYPLTPNPKGNDPDRLENFEKNIPVSIYFITYHAGIANINLKLERTESVFQQWQQETFSAIIEAYETKLEEYNAKVKELKALQTEKKRSNPLFYRQIENIILKKNCIEYMADHANLGEVSFLIGEKTNNIQVNNSRELETYSAKIKFFEQAFEWDLMSYNFYPFYWAQKNQWGELYNIDETDDAIFRAFLQSGMARVILTIRPGFEEAVNWYMATGQVWNGGQVPTLDDELFISIVDELRETEGEVEETWETRVPTSLTMIQAGSIGMEVPTALPCDEDCKDYKMFDSDGKPILDKDNKQVSKNPFKKKSTILKGKSSTVKPIENIDLNNGFLQLATDSNPRKVVAQISVEAIKREMGL